MSSGRPSCKRVGALIGVAAMLVCGCAEQRSLDIYFIDMVGGAATLVVTPAAESILVDSGSALERDAERIRQVVHDVARLSRIDHMVITHWHLDHYGAIGLLEGRLEFGRFYDRGIPDQVPEDPRNFPRLIAAYRRVSNGQSVKLSAGQEIPLTGGKGPPLRLQCLMADGRIEPDPPQGAESNPCCDQHAPKPPDETENGKSLVMLLSYGDFDFCIPGDLTWNFEKDLVCPVNRVGRVELLQVSHHGLPSSSNPVFVHAVGPKVAVMPNGPGKGGDLAVIKTLRESPGLLDLWQLHRNLRTAESDNAPLDRVANWGNPEGGAYIKVRVDPSGKTFQVQIGPDRPPVLYQCWDHKDPQ